MDLHCNYLLKGMLKPIPRVPRFACLHCSTFRPLVEIVIVKIKYLIRNGATETEIDEFRLSRRKQNKYNLT